MNPMIRTLTQWLQCTLLLVAVVSCVTTAAPVAAQSPASPDAATAEAPEGSSVFAKSEASSDEHGEHAGAHGHKPGASQGHAESHAPSETGQGDQATMYTCPMHPEIRQQGPGRCPKCGMALEPEKSQDNHNTAHDHGAPHEHNEARAAQAAAQGDHATMYTCPMHPEIRQQGPGRCPKCGMALEPEKSENQ